MAFLLLLILLLLLPTSLCQSPTPCGSLITYRQLSDLLASAPECLISGCQSPSPSPTSAILSLSSGCPPPSPCGPLWNLLLQSSHQDWCTTCSDSKTDTACRIPGWPILNSTSACSISPHTWLFSNASSPSSSTSGCCTATADDPFLLAAWVGRLCNGSAWREPFSSYGGMAREDWVEWMQPWNWTVHQHNSTDRNFTTAEVSVCESAKAMEVAFLVDNFVSAGWAALELFVYWLCCICAWGVVMKEVGPWQKSLAGGLVTGGLYLVSNFATAVLWDHTPRYGEIPTGHVGLLLCARPSVLGFFCLVSIWGREQAERSLRSPREGEDPEPEPWFERERVKQWRKAVGGWLRRAWPFKAKDQSTEVTDADLEDGRETAKQLLTGFALNIGVSELVLQVSSVYSIWKTTIVGNSRGFYSRYALVPFYGGSAAARMYGGALLHCIFLFPSTFALVAIAWSHAKEQEYRKVRRLFFADERREHALQEYYNSLPRPGWAVTERDRERNRAMLKMQRALESSAFGTTPLSFWTKTWRWVKERLTACFSRLRHGRNRNPTKPPPRTWPTAERGFISTLFHNGLIRATVRVMAPLNRLVESTTQSTQPTDPESADAKARAGASRLQSPEVSRPRSTGTSGLRSNLRHFAGRCLSFGPIRTRIANSLQWAVRQQEDREREIAEAEQGPERERFNEILQQLERNRNLAEVRAGNSRLPSVRGFILFITTSFVTINYISQWLFWSGYVETAGERYVP